jgi:hypothetical protein
VSESNILGHNENIIRDSISENKVCFGFKY